MANLSSWMLSGLGLLALLFLVALYNGLVKSRNQVSNGLAQISVQLQRRYDLIPNLVATAERYLAHEKSTLEAVISARNAAHSAVQRLSKGASALAAVTSANGLLDGALKNLLALAESYPELKGDHGMSQLAEELASTENRVAFARQAYNDAVMRYDDKRLSFPASLIAGIFGFGAFSFWELENEQARQAVRVSFS
jgi:LemA protein